MQLTQRIRQTTLVIPGRVWFSKFQKVEVQRVCSIWVMGNVCVCLSIRMVGKNHQSKALHWDKKSNSLRITRAGNVNRVRRRVFW